MSHDPLDFQPIHLTVGEDIEDALALVRRGSSDALVAGGCLRDAHFGVQKKDIDIYVGPAFDAEKVQSATASCFLDVHEDRIREYSQFYGDRMTAVYSVRSDTAGFADDFLCEADAAPTIQVIQMKEPVTLANVLGGFDFGFCQVASRSGDLVWASKHFRWDAENNTATSLLARNDLRLRHSVLRANRLKGRYPTRRFLFPL